MFGLNLLRNQNSSQLKKIPFYKKKKFWVVLLTIAAGIVAGTISYTDALRQGVDLFMNN